MTGTRTVSRQRKWALKMIAEGRCRECGKPLATRVYCRRHADANAATQRAWYRRNKTGAATARTRTRRPIPTR